MQIRGKEKKRKSGRGEIKKESKKETKGMKEKEGERGRKEKEREREEWRMEEKEGRRQGNGGSERFAVAPTPNFSPPPSPQYKSTLYQAAAPITKTNRK